MMRFFKIWIVFIALGLQTVSAQEKLFTMQDAMVNSRTTLAPENIKQFQFIKNTPFFAYLKKTDSGEVFVKADFKNTDGNVLLTLNDLNKHLLAAGLEEVKSWPRVQIEQDAYTVNIKRKEHRFLFSNGTHTPVVNPVTDDKEVLSVSDAGYTVYTEEHNLYFVSNGKVQQITNDGSPVIVYGKPVHQQEFGIFSGTFWSSNGKKLAYYRMDQHMVPQYPIINWAKRPAVNDPIYYPMAGDKSHHVTLEVFEESGKKIHINTGVPAEQYLTNIAWSPDDRFIYIAVVNRGQDHMRLNQYDAQTGAFVKTLFEEKHDKYVEPQTPMKFLKSNPDLFLWESRRDGWNHVYLYDENGKLIKQLTSGEWEVTEVKGMDKKDQQLYYVSTEQSPLVRNLYAVNIKSGKHKRITQGNLHHTVQLNEDATLALDNASDVQTPRVVSVIDLQTGKSKELLRADNPLKAYKLANMHQIKLISNDGFELHGRLYQPVDFDPNKKYPVVVYWYGGPHAQLTYNAWNGGSGDLWFQYMAQNGFVVFTLDTRGSANRGAEFEQTIFRHAGKPQMEDLLIGVEYLKTLSYADTKRMGLFGWSYGGFMTTSFLLHHPGIFKAGVAGGPVMDWSFYEIMYTERYMDTPQENPEGYEATNLVKKAGKLKDKLLLIHGMQDPVVVMQHSVNFVKSAVDNNVQVDYMIYPGHEHNVRGKDRTHLYQKVTDYFMQHV
jgi:dipeptidyl-peptidase-4